jgi:hypothetical protein
MREAEFAATAASLADPSYKYPKDVRAFHRRDVRADAWV